MIFAEDKQKQRLRWCFKDFKNGAWGEEGNDDEPGVICIRAADFEGATGRLNEGSRTYRYIDEKTFQNVELGSGDLIIEKSGGGEKQLVGRTVLFEGEGPAVCSNFLARCRVDASTDPKFGNYLMLAFYVARGTYPFIKQSTGIQNLDLPTFMGVKIELPDLDTQRRIAGFLDERTARIDALIAKKRALLDRLAEKRQALITRAVTQGLNPAAPMKDSGIGWLGQIPAHWDMKALYRITNPARPIRYGIVLPGPHFEDGVPIIKGGDVKPDRLTLDLLNRTDPEIEAGYEKSRMKAGEIVYSIRGSYGDVEIVPPELDGCNLTQDTARISPEEGVDTDWLLFALKSDAVLLQLRSTALGSTIKGVNIFHLRRVPLPVPPQGEQPAIGAFIRRATSRLDDLVSRCVESIEKLIEYRAALVTAAVTGKVEV